MDKLNSELREKAVALGMCEQWIKDWDRDWTREELAENLFKGINFCADKRFPDSGYLVRNFDKTWLRSKGILADDTYSLLNPERAFITGASSSNVRFNGTSSGVLHIQGSSKVSMTVRNRSRVIVHLWDSASLDVEKDMLARLLVVRHSPETWVSSKNVINVKTRY